MGSTALVGMRMCSLLMARSRAAVARLVARDKQVRDHECVKHILVGIRVAALVTVRHGAAGHTPPDVGFTRTGEPDEMGEDFGGFVPAVGITQSEGLTGFLEPFEMIIESEDIAFAGAHHVVGGIRVHKPAIDDGDRSLVDGAVLPVDERRPMSVFRRMLQPRVVRVCRHDVFSLYHRHAFHLRKTAVSSGKD